MISNSSINWLSDKIYKDPVIGAKLRYRLPTNEAYEGTSDAPTSFRVHHNWSQQSGGFGTMLGKGLTKLTDIIQSFVRSVQQTAGEFGISTSSTLTGLNLSADSTSLFKQYTGTENNIDVPQFTITFLPKSSDPTINNFEEKDSPLSQLEKFLTGRPKGAQDKLKEAQEVTDKETKFIEDNKFGSLLNTVKDSTKNFTSDVNNAFQSFYKEVASIYNVNVEYLQGKLGEDTDVEAKRVKNPNKGSLVSAYQSLNNQLKSAGMKDPELKNELDRCRGLITQYNKEYENDLVNSITKFTESTNKNFNNYAGWVDNYFENLKNPKTVIGMDKLLQGLSIGSSKFDTGLIGAVEMFSVFLLSRGPSNYQRTAPTNVYPNYLPGTYVLTVNGVTYFNLLPENIETTYSKSRLWFNNKDYGPAWIKCVVSFTPAIAYITRDIKYIMKNTYNVGDVSKLAEEADADNSLRATAKELSKIIKDKIGTDVPKKNK